MSSRNISLFFTILLILLSFYAQAFLPPTSGIGCLADLKVLVGGPLEKYLAGNEAQIYLNRSLGIAYWVPHEDLADDLRAALLARKSIMQDILMGDPEYADNCLTIIPKRVKNGYAEQKFIDNTFQLVDLRDAKAVLPGRDNYHKEFLTEFARRRMWMQKKVKEGLADIELPGEKISKRPFDSDAAFLMARSRDLDINTHEKGIDNIILQAPEGKDPYEYFMLEERTLKEMMAAVRVIDW